MDREVFVRVRPVPPSGPRPPEVLVECVREGATAQSEALIAAQFVRADVRMRRVGEELPYDREQQLSQLRDSVDSAALSSAKCEARRKGPFDVHYKPCGDAGGSPLALCYQLPSLSTVGQACGYFESPFLEVRRFTADVPGVTHSWSEEILCSPLSSLLPLKKAQRLSQWSASCAELFATTQLDHQCQVLPDALVIPSQFPLP